MIILDNNNIDCITCQVQSKVDYEIGKKFLPKRKDSILLSESFSRLYCKYFNENNSLKAEKYLKRFSRVENCGTIIEFGITYSDEHKLYKANFCKDRLCPMCSWRRSYKIFGQISQIMNVIENDYQFIFLTLTVPNCYGWELPALIDKMQNAFRKGISNNRKFKKSVKGYFRALEVTHDIEPIITKKMYDRKKSYYDNLCLSVGDVNPNYNKYHPHYHCILAVEPSYFHKFYIKRDEWLSMWQNAMKDNSITQVDVRLCKQKEKLKDSEYVNYKKISSAVSEVAKYSVKSNDYIVRDDIEMTDISVDSLSSALDNRRLCTLGGVFKKTLQQLKLDDMEDGDLVNVDGSSIRSDLFKHIYRYEWGVGCYKLTEIIDI